MKTGLTREQRNLLRLRDALTVVLGHAATIEDILDDFEWKYVTRAELFEKLRWLLNEAD